MKGQSIDFIVDGAGPSCQVIGKSSSMSADVYTDLTIGLGMKNYPQNDPSYALFHALVPKLHEGHLP